MKQQPDTVCHFGTIKAIVDEKSRTIILSLSREPAGEISTVKLLRWAIATLERRYPGFTLENRIDGGRQ